LWLRGVDDNDRLLQAARHCDVLDVVELLAERAPRAKQHEAAHAASISLVGDAVLHYNILTVGAPDARRDARDVQHGGRDGQAARHAVAAARLFGHVPGGAVRAAQHVEEDARAAGRRAAIEKARVPLARGLLADGHHHGHGERFRARGVARGLEGRLI